MKFEMMRGPQVRRAVEDNLPLVVPAGTIEYHGEHLGVGCDTLVVVRALERLEAEMPMVLAPPFYYGTASFAVAGPEMGTVDVDNDRLSAHVKDVLRGFLEIGFRKIIVVIHHQYEGGTEQPMTLAFKKPTAELVHEFLEAKHGRGWWGDEKYATFYDELDSSECPWNWLKVIPLMHPDVQARTGYDHAGEHETSLLWALCPEAVDMDARSQNTAWYTRSAEKASLEYGRQMIDLILAQLRTAIAGADVPEV
jgi:creatinine amidohydrolase/Fe(II)-dependent formamide hydrolase-like protein